MIHYLPLEAHDIPHVVTGEANPETTTEYRFVTCPACRKAMEQDLDTLFRRLGPPPSSSS